MTRPTARGLAPALILALAACPGWGAGPDPFDEMEPATFANAEDARNWSGMSAPNIFVLSQFFALAPLFESAEDDVESLECPRWEEDGDRLTITGGCTDAEGLVWRGLVEVERAATPVGIRFPGGSNTNTEFASIRTRRFGFEGTRRCGGDDHTISAESDGELTIRDRGDGRRTFEVDLGVWTSVIDEETCAREEQVLGLDYSGELRLEDFDDDGMARRSTWEGSGRAGTGEMGWAQVETVDQRIDVTACAYTPLSGVTNVVSEGRILAIRYQGETECDQEARAEWLLDGETQGELEGIHCASGTGPAGWAAPVLLALGLASAGAARRRHLNT